MKRELLSQISILLLCVMLFAILGVDVFYILHNAEWLIGDDAAMLRRTAMGIPFRFSESILPDKGFFRPFDYLHENIVLLFHSGMHSAFEHYIINACSFILCMSALMGILWMTVKPKNVTDYAIIVFGVITIASRLIGVYINVFGPVYGVYTYHMLAIFFLCLFFKNDTVWAMVLSLLCWVYSMLIYENVCLVLGCVGLFPMLFAYKRLTKKQIIYCFSMIALACIFLMIYVFVIYLPSKGVSHYDPAHDSGIGLMENAKNMIFGQKLIWVAAIVWLYRQIKLLRKKNNYHILYDTLLWASGGMVLGAVVLRMNWTMYYYDALILSLPSIVYFTMHLHEKYGRYIALGITILFAAWHSINVPKNFRRNQKDRIETSLHMNLIASNALKGWSIVWYDGEKLDEVTEGMKSFRKESTRCYMQYLLKNNTWDYNEKNGERTIIFYPKENDKSSEEPHFLEGYTRTTIGVTSGVSYYIIGSNEKAN